MILGFDMQTSNIIHVVSCHAEGEVGDVIVGGVPNPPGESIWDQSKFLENDQCLRNFILNEPRGGVFRHVNLLVPPRHPNAQMGWIIMEPVDNPPMSGSNAICVVTVLLETGILPMQEPITELTLEPPGGLITVRASCKNGKVTKVSIKNVPSFVSNLDTKLEVAGLGTINVDVAFGGDSFVIVNAKELGFNITEDEALDIARIGMSINVAANEQLQFQHPTSDWSQISFCQLALPVHTVNGVKTGRNSVIIKPGKLDRSPCGTGCSARLAVLYAKGQVRMGEVFCGESIIGSKFECLINDTTFLEGMSAIVPIISGQGWITGTHQYFLDPSDPWPNGYRLSDTWPGA